ncbi:DUF3050 domain-containing protein [Sphingobacterium psychroaquaticum]|uniref:DUF3050 domain-containing protein n=1 Tax=Sphingobacterium psychroaquaticum TaxID=561061 RepID=A0A1X7IZ30_9SPHI|nr:DUF3050 domain-containing protein [Sphingobacterium psychroaquaticum]SMG20450.1 Protein of unknown function [Sphingobacterium psychroaquaticum]
MNRISIINEAIKEERDILLQHPLYAQIQTIADLRKFTEGHVYAVWDFMSLLKALQIQLTCTTIPWFASEYPTTRYLINEIVLAEESDEYIDGRRLSHFEMYLDAMERMEADTIPVTVFLKDVKERQAIMDSIAQSELDPRIKDFLAFTFETVSNGRPHEIAAAFTFGREDLIPDMFSSILTEIQQRFPDVDLQHFIYYFQRHIELDGDEHGPLAMKMIEELAGDDDQKWKEMTTVSKQALQKRIALWDAILDSLGK